MATDRPAKPAARAPRASAVLDEGSGTGYVAATKGVHIRVTPQFDADRSNPERGQYFWLYTVEIRNDGRATVQLISRHWKITDAQGRVQEVKGEGVVGKQPVLEPGEEFRYTSGCPLPTPTGFMVGTYQMTGASGASFDAVIPAFSLDSPHMKRSLN
jgi:ApaG protein